MKIIEQNNEYPTLASVKRVYSDFVKIVRVTGGWAVFFTWDEYETWKNQAARTKNPAAVALGRLGGRSRSPAKIAAVRANGAKGGRPIRPAGDSHVWTFAEVAAAFGDRSFVSPAGRGLFVRATCCPGEDSTDPAFFDVAPNWADHIGPYDDCDRSVDDLVRKVAAKFPSPKGWTYRPDNGTIDQVATFSMPGWAPVAGL